MRVVLSNHARDRFKERVGVGDPDELLRGVHPRLRVARWIRSKDLTNMKLAGVAYTKVWIPDDRDWETQLDVAFPVVKRTNCMLAVTCLTRRTGGRRMANQ